MAVKRAFYIMTFTPLWAEVIEKMAREFNYDPALFVGMEALKDVPFYHVNDARAAILPSEVYEFKPFSLDPEILSYYDERQSVLMEMISRFSLGKKAGSFEQRRQYLWEMIRIWEGLFEQFKPDAVFAGSMPHRVFDYVVYLICERKNIPFMALEATSLPHLFYACTSVHDQSGIFSASKFKIQPTKPLLPETESFYHYVRAAEDDYKPYNLSLGGLFTSYKVKQAESKGVRDVFKKLPYRAQTVINIAKSILRRDNTELRTRIAFHPEERFISNSAKGLRLIDNQFLEFRAAKEVGLAEKWYKKNCSSYDPGRPYVYFAANFMPERSTVPDSGYFYDYSLIFSMLERSVPADWQIIYKEHPRSFRRPIAAENPRDVDFFLRIRDACPRLIFLDQQTDSKRLIKEARAVATASGTSGWEAVARGIPALLFGERWYGSCQGVHCIYSLDDLKAAIEYIRHYPVVPSENVVDFLKRVESVSEDMSYYYKDNIEERSRYSGTVDTRVFTPEELEYRKMFIQKMAEFFSSNIERVGTV